MSNRVHQGLRLTMLSPHTALSCAPARPLLDEVKHPSQAKPDLGWGGPQDAVLVKT